MATTGQCLCGAVAFTGTTDPGKGVSVCHCGQCRRWCSGPLMSQDMIDGVTLTKSDGLVWYKSSDRGERGFCRFCGSSLFWREPGAASDWGVSAGAPDHAAGLRIGSHIWVDDQPAFYDFADDAPRLTASQATAAGQ